MSMTPNGGLGPTGNSGLGPTGATLPVWDTVGEAFASSVRQPRGLLWSVVGIWTVILAAFQIVLGFVDPPLEPTAIATGEIVPGEPGSGAVSALNLIMSLVNIVAVVDIAVVWVRYLVMEEQPQRFLDGRLNRRRWAYFLRLLILIIAVAGFAFGIVILLVVGGGFGLDLGPDGMWIVFVPFVLLAIYLMFGRFGLYLTAATLGDPRVSLHESWRLSSGNSLRLTAVVIIVGIATMILAAVAVLIVTSILVLISPILAVAVGATVAAVVSIWSLLVNQAVLARAYMLLVPEPAPGTLRL